jgi:flagellar biosynthesis GTPase FlhF
VYNERVENNVNVTRVSYNGGRGGIEARATVQEEAAARERHVGPVAAQTQHFQAARSNPELRASHNHGKPPIAATSRPGSFSGGGVVAARSGGNYNPPANRGGNGSRGGNNANRPESDRRPANETNNPNRPPNASTRTENNTNRAENNRSYSHASEVPKHTAPEVSNPNPKYQQQQEKLNQKQAQEHQKLQQQQEKEHQQMTKQNANAAKQQQIEQRHQQQTQQMEQKHQQQQEKVQRSAQPRPAPREEKKPH